MIWFEDKGKSCWTGQSSVEVRRCKLLGEAKEQGYRMHRRQVDGVGSSQGVRVRL